MKPRSIAVAALAAALALQAFASVYTATITVDGYSGSSTLADFPVLVRVSEQNVVGFKYSQCADDGSDLSFAAADGTALPHEIDTWDASGESAVWVRLPSLAKGTSFVMRWGEAPESAAAASDTWNSDYVGVWHLGEADGVCANSTSLGEAMDATPAGAGKSASALYSGSDAPVGGARTTSAGNGTGTASGGYLSVPSYDAQGVGSSFTVSGWVRMTAISANVWPRLFSRKAVYNAAAGWETSMYNNSYVQFDARGAGSTSVNPSFSDGVGAREWRHVAFVYEGSKLSVYGDGVMLGSGTIASATDNALPMSIGSNSDGSENCLPGAFDECRLMKGAASADWLAAEFATVSDDGFLAYGVAEGEGIGGELGVSVVAVKAVGDNYADVQVMVSGLGDGASSATVTLMCGEDAGSLATAATATVSGRGVLLMRVPRLLPAHSYVVRADVANDLGGTASSETATLATAESADNFYRPGLLQAYYPSSYQNRTAAFAKPAEGTDWTRYTDADRVCRRELGPIMAYVGGQPKEMSYVSEVWGDEVYWPANGGTWLYWGFIYLEAGKTYRFRMAVDDYKGLKLTDPATGAVTTLIDNSTWNDYVTSVDYAPETTGFYPVEVRLSDNSGGLGGVAAWDNYANSTNMGYSADGGETWSMLLDPGDGSLLMVDGGESSISVSERYSGGAWTGVDLSFAAADADRTLTAVWGDVHGGDAVSGWANSATVSVAAGETTLSYDFPEGWGSDGCSVVRFNLGEMTWSPSVYWHASDSIVISDLAADASGGDMLKLVGSVSAFPGESCSLTVLTGSSADALDDEWTGLSGATLSVAGAFELTLFDGDAESSRHFAPGGTYYACVVATSDGKASRSSVVKVTMAGAAELADAASGVNRKLVVTGSVKDAGMNGKTKASLWVGTWSDNKVQVGDAVEVGAGGTFSFTYDVEKFDTPYYWEVRAVNESAGGTATAESSSAGGSYVARDSTVYTWKGPDGGAWSDAANWSDDRGGDCKGYPQDGWATVAAAANSSGRVLLDAKREVYAIDMTAAGSSLTLAQGGAGTNETRLTVYDVKFAGKGAKLTLDNVALYTPQKDVVVYASDEVVVSNGSDWSQPTAKQGFDLRSGGTLRISGRSTVSLTDVKIGAGLTEIDDSTLTVAGWTFYNRDVEACRVRFAGKNPVMRMTGDEASFWPGTSGGGGLVEFSFAVPKDGFAEAPLQATASASYLGRCGTEIVATVPMKILVEADSPAAKAARTTETALVSWPTAGIARDTVVTTGELPGKDDAFVWGDGDRPQTLGVSIVGEARGLIFLVR